MAYFHIINGQKGGVGKSTFAKILIEYFYSKSRKFQLFDMDATALDVGKIYAPDVYNKKKKKEDKNNEENFLRFTANKSSKDEVDILFDAALNEDVICNLPSNIKHLFNPWIKENGLIELAQENNITFVNWFVCSGETQSIAEFIESVDNFTNSETFKHVFVRNFGLEENWQKVIDNNKSLRETIESDKIITSDLPALSPTRFKLVLDNGLTFNSAKSSKELGIVARQGVSKFLETAFINLDVTFLDLLIDLQVPVGAEG